MPLFSRLGPYPRETLDELTVHQDGRDGWTRASRRELFEYWGHEASLIPVDMQPLMRWRMARADDLAWAGVARVAKDDPKLVKRVLELVRDQGPIRAADVGSPEAGAPGGRDVELERGQESARVPLLRRPGDGRAAGQLRAPLRPARAGPPRRGAGDADAARRRGAAGAAALRRAPARGRDRARPRRLLPPAARRLESAARRAGRGGGAADRRGEGMERARLRARPTSRCRGGSAARALLTPFDSMVWARERTERLFDFRYRIEIYVPAPKRVHGYYVLPFLLGDRLVARVDLKSDRQAGVLRVVGAFAEPKVDADVVARELADELRLVSEWLGLGGVEVARKGDLAADAAKGRRLMPQPVTYTFGDSDLAARRLELRRDHLPGHDARFPAAPRRRAGPALAVDLGSGPGHTTVLLRETLAPGAHARRRLLPRLRRGGRAKRAGGDRGRGARRRRARTCRSGVTDADVIFVRHAADPPARPARRGRRSGASGSPPGGVLLLEEVDSIATDEPALARYLAAAGGDAARQRQHAGDRRRSSTRACARSGAAQQRGGRRSRRPPRSPPACSG